MTPTVEDAVAKLKANEMEDAQQILIKILNEDAKNDLAWKYLIESYSDLNFQIELADEYFNLTAGSLKATQTQLRLVRRKLDRLERSEKVELKWPVKSRWLDKIQWTKPLVVKVITGLVALFLLSNLILFSTNIGSLVRSGQIRSDFQRLTSVYSELLLKYSQLEARYNQSLTPQP